MVEGNGTAPGLAIVANSVAPYRINLHRALSAGLPEFRLHSVFTHGAAEFQWEMDLPPEIHPVFFGSPGDSPLLGLRSSLRAEWRKGARIIEYLRRANTVAVISHGYNYVSNLRVIDHFHRAGIAVFLRGDSNVLLDENRRGARQLAKRAFLRWVFSRVDAVMPAGTLGARYFNKYGIARDRIFEVPFLPDYASFEVVDAARLKAFRLTHGIDPGRRHLIFCGRLTGVKRVDLLIEAFARIAESRPEWSVLIIGRGALESELRARVPFNLTNRFHWVGFLGVDELPLAYHSSDVLVVPSDVEPWAVVVQEAMAAKLVVVASDVVGSAFDLVQDGVSGRIFPRGDLAGLVDALADATSDERLSSLKKGSAASLSHFRRTKDPVSAVRAALETRNLLAARSGCTDTQPGESNDLGA